MKNPLRTAAEIALWMTLAGSLPAAQQPFAGGENYVPAKIHQRARIEFPARALAEGILSGKAVVLLDVDAFGELRDVLVIAYTEPEFAEAVLTAIKGWRFTPGSIDGEPAASNVRLVVEFQVNGVLAYVRPTGPPRESTSDLDGFTYRPWSIATLDRLPAAISRTSPIYPKDWITAGRVGTVLVEFYIDEAGRARFPVIVGEADELLGVAAVAAMKEWRFEPPLRRGRPVLVHAQQVFHFRPEARAGKS